MSHGERSKEPIEWSSEDLKAKSSHRKKKSKSKSGKVEKPGAKYGAVSEAIRHTISPQTTCAMFCGGKKCKYELAEPWKEDQQAITGVFSNWITENIVATARPNTVNMEKYNIIEQFKEKGITAIINLQQPGEHASCGSGLEDGGFSYLPQTFMDNDIYFYNFGWPDYGVGSLGNLLDMVKVMQFALSEGKVAVHCHAGLGRTGVLIAAYLIFANRMNPNEVVHFIRSKRPPSIQTRSQFQFIEEFAQYLPPLRVVFSSQAEGAYDFTLPQYLIRQKHMLHGFEARMLKHIPKILDVCCNRLLELAGKALHATRTKDNYDIMKKTASSAFNNQSTRPAVLHRDSSDSDIGGGSGGGGGASRQRPKLSKKLSVSLESFSAVTRPGASGQTGVGLSRSSSEQEDGDSESEPAGRSAAREVNGGGHRRLNGVGSDGVAQSMACADYSSEVRQRVKDYKTALNVDLQTWCQLEEEDDPCVVACLVWDWLDELKEPVLHIQDLPLMLEYSSEPLEGLNQLNKGAHATVERLFEVISALEPMGEAVEQDLIQRAISTLTHQNMVLESDPVISPARQLVRRTSNDTGLMRGSVANRLMIFFLHLIHVQMEAIAQAEVNGAEAEADATRTPSARTKRPPSAKGHSRTPPAHVAKRNAASRQRRISEGEDETD